MYVGVRVVWVSVRETAACAARRHPEQTHGCKLNVGTVVCAFLEWTSSGGAGTLLPTNAHNLFSHKSLMIKYKSPLYFVYRLSRRAVLRMRFRDVLLSPDADLYCILFTVIHDFDDRNSYTRTENTVSKTELIYCMGVIV